MPISDTDTADEPTMDDADSVQPDAASDSRAERTPAAVDSPGRALAAARRARKLEITRVASELRLKPETVDAIERDDYEHLPSPVFVSGYIRTYARLLGLDPQPLIARFHVLHPGAEAPPRSALENQELARSGSGWLVPLLLFAVVLIGAGGYLWWTGSQVDPFRSASNGSDAAEDIASDEATDSAPPAGSYASSPMPPTDATDLASTTDDGTLGTDDAPSDESLSDGLASESVGALGAADAVTRSDDATSDLDGTVLLPSEDIQLLPSTGSLDGIDEDAPGPMASLGANGDEPIAEPATDATDAGEVVVSFSGPCWVDVRDATGEVQLFGEMADGDRRVLGGEPPYSLVIGNASAVTMTVGGAPFDVRAIAKGNVARFELDPAEIAASAGTDASPSAD